MEFSQAFFKRKAAAGLQILQRLRVHRVEFSSRRVRFHLPIPVVVLVAAQFRQQFGALFEGQFLNGFLDFGCSPIEIITFGLPFMTLLALKVNWRGWLR